MVKFDPDRAVVPPTNFGYKNSAEKFLECGKFRKCANLRLLPAQLKIVRLHIPVCMESRFNRTGRAEWLPMPVFGQPLSPLTYTTVGEWAPHISCPVKCKGYRSARWAKILSWFRPMKSKRDISESRGVLSNDWVVGLGVATIGTFAALAVAFILKKEVEAAELLFAATASATILTALVVWLLTPKAATASRDERTKSPQKGDQWEAVARKFGNLVTRPIPIRAEWMYTVETKYYRWTVRHSSDTEVKLCIAICDEAGRLLLAEPSFRKKFPDIATIADDGDRWLVAIYKVATIGQVTANATEARFGVVVATGEGGEIKDLPGASRVLCQMALNGF
jgi:hypothetical protein